MRYLIRVARIGAGVFLLGGIVNAPTRAEPLPLPAVDYQAKAKMMGGGAVTIHHAGGKLRLEIQPVGLAQTITGIVDLPAHKMFMIGAVPGMNAMAMEIDIGKDASYGTVVGDGKRVGSATVAGESCGVWEVDGKGSGPVTTCIGRDNIPLKTEATIEGKRRTIMEVTELLRTRQDPAQFALPANVQVIKMPKGVVPAGIGGPAKQ
jgi:hypothetical protein